MTLQVAHAGGRAGVVGLRQVARVVLVGQLAAVVGQLAHDRRHRKVSLVPPSRTFRSNAFDGIGANVAAGVVVRSSTQPSQVVLDEVNPDWSAHPRIVTGSYDLTASFVWST
jgi:hypothetical protein